MKLAEEFQKKRTRAGIIRMIDMFCGAGGTSTGAIEAAERCGFDVRVQGINHWEIACATFRRNHPEQPRPLCKSVDDVHARSIYKEGECDILIASPECTHHSVAAGGRPINDQSRATAWCVVRFAEAMRPGVIIIENVPEFVNWGGIDRNGRPLKHKKGKTFQAFVAALESLGYKVSWKLHTAADFGDPTSRTRLIMQAVLGRRQICFPNPTHGPGTVRPWTTAADEVIDWSLEGQSIFERSRGLVPKSIRRILVGLEKFCLEPFLHEHPRAKGSGVRSAKRPLSTVTSTSSDYALTQTFMIEHRGTGKSQLNNSAKSPKQPLSAVATSGAHHAIAKASFLVQVNHGNGKCGHKGDKRRVKSVDEPIPTVCGSRGEFAKVSALIQQQSGGVARNVNEPVPTVATSGAVGKADFIITIDHQSAGGSAAVHSVHDQVTTLTTKARHSLISPFFVRYNGAGVTVPVTKPTPAITTKDRFAVCRPSLELVTEGDAVFRRVDYFAWRRLVLAQSAKGLPLTRLYIEIEGTIYMIEITHRMLQVHELARAQGFPPDYVFEGNKTQQVKQIGNAVPRRLARAIIAAVLTQDPNVDWVCDEEQEEQAA